jgi:hypothetical protein
VFFDNYVRPSAPVKEQTTSGLHRKINHGRNMATRPIIKNLPHCFRIWHDFDIKYCADGSSITVHLFQDIQSGMFYEDSTAH